ncbi:putative cyclin-D7-1 [Pyrus communis]|uniref:putative cyclin-D7-1 n=1 Tax=Pyrus communis TaxID=23211 RepID=UPI0035C1C5AD
MVCMESLLCDEVCPSSPAVTTEPIPGINFGSKSYCRSISMYTTKEEYEQALTICMEKEKSYMPEPNYLDNLCSNNLVIARLKSIQWFIKSSSRLNLSPGTVFYAANYLDRFMSTNHCNGWKYWMVELVSIACLSIASKFSDTYNPSLLEIQMEDLEHSFEPSTIQRVEMMVLNALGWRLASTTAYSYLELFSWFLDSLKPQLHEEIIALLNNLLLRAISDSKFLDYRPSVVAISALRCSLDKIQLSAAISDNAYLTCLTSVLDNDQKGELVKCHKMMEEQYSSVDCLHRLRDHEDFHYCPSSPTTQF